MKKWIAIVFLSLYFSTTTELFQLLKFPVLIEHYIEHKSINQKITFWGFLCMHYAHGDVYDADYDKDMKLPFKSHSFQTNSTCFTLINLQEYSICFYRIIVHKNSVNNFYKTIISSSHLNAIWQPPQIC